MQKEAIQKSATQRARIQKEGTQKEPMETKEVVDEGAVVGVEGVVAVEGEVQEGMEATPEQSSEMKTSIVLRRPRGSMQEEAGHVAEGGVGGAVALLGHGKDLRAGCQQFKKRLCLAILTM